jgi:hypothetical protein
LPDAKQFATKCGLVIEWNGKPVIGVETAFGKAARSAGGAKGVFALAQNIIDVQ